MDPAGARELANRIAEEKRRRAAAEGAPEDGSEPAVDMRGAVDRLQAELATLRSEVGARDDTIARLRMELTELRAKGTADGDAPEKAPPNEGAQAHLLFISHLSRYELVPRDGPVPPVDGELVLGDGVEGRYRVCKVGPSPLPGDPRRCAFLEPIG
jgi:hypothetical protein